MRLPSRYGRRADSHPAVWGRIERPWAIVAASARIWALLLFALGLLEAAVLQARLPAPWSVNLLLSMVWSALLLGALGLVVGAFVGLGLGVVPAMHGRRARVPDARATAWAVAVSAILGFYWVYAANRLYPGPSRDLRAFALDGAAGLGAALLLLLLLRRGRLGMTRAAVERRTAVLFLLLWLPLYMFSASPQAERIYVLSTSRQAGGTWGTGPGAVARRQEAPGVGSEPPMNVLLIMMDTVRADCLGCYGSTECPTPSIDRLASEAILFEQTVSPEPRTRPSVCTMFTGLFPRTHGVDTNTKALDDGFLMLAETLRDAGYATAAFTAASVLSGYYGTDQGFDLYTEPASEP